MASRVRVRDVDHGYRAFMASVRAFERTRPRIRTGVISAAASAPHQQPAKKGRRKQDDAPPARPALTVAQIGMIHEFGLGRMPERSFLRANFDANRGAYQKALVAGVRRELLAATKQGIVIDINNTQTLKRVALKVEGDIKRRIRSRIAPANTPGTIRRKGSSVPLVHTGQLIRTIGSEIGPAGGAR